MAQNFPYTAEYQNLLIACLVEKSAEFEWIAPELRPNYFTGSQPTVVARCLIEYHKSYSRFPSWTVLRELSLRESAKVKDDNSDDSINEFLDEVKKLDTRDWEHVRDNVTGFLRERAYVVALQKAVKYLQDDKVPETGLSPLFDEASKVGQNLDDMGFIFHADVDRVVKMVTANTYGVQTGFPMLDKIWKNGWGPGWLIVPLAPPKRFKCQHPDTEILMKDGATKRICEIKVGDQVMGDDSTPRNVLSCGDGYGPLYRVEQANGDDYIVNEDHVLCLKRPGCTAFAEITAKDYLRQPKRFKQQWKGYKVGVEFRESPLPSDPYCKGRQLGSEAAKNIPFAYRVNSRRVRLKLLAGLIDESGIYASSCGFIFTSASEELCKDACWIARSLGFKASVKCGKKRCVVRIQGKISEIPVVLLHEAPWKDSDNAHDCTSIKVSRISDGKWFGIEVDGDHRYLHSDFTVTHNSATCINLATNMISPQIAGDVIYYACEISQELAMTRAMCNISGLSGDYMFETPEKFAADVKKKMEEAVAGNLLFKSFASKAASITDIRSHARAAVKQYGLNLKAIFIDYAETVKGDADKNEPEYRKSAAVYTGARALGAELGCCVVMPDRCNKDTTDKPVPSMTSFQGSFEKAGIVDVAFGLCVHRDQGVITGKGIIKIGDLRHLLRASSEPVLVLSHNFETGLDEWKPVLNWFNNGATDTAFLSIKTDAMCQVSARSIVTQDHLFFTPDGNKIKACDLSVGDKIWARTAPATVTDVREFPLQKRKHLRHKIDIEVADNHNYYLASGALVSNCSTDDEYRANTIRWFNFLNRHGQAFQHLRGRVDPVTWRMEFNEEVPYEEESEMREERPGRRRSSVPKELADDK